MRAKATSETDARRFAVYVTEEMLRRGQIEGKDINDRLAQAAFMERAFYELARQDSMPTMPLPKIECIRLHLEPNTYNHDCISDNTRAAYLKAKAIVFGTSRKASKIRKSRKSVA